MKNETIEKSVLGILLLEENIKIALSEGLLPEYFSCKINKTIFQYLVKLHSSNKPINLLSLMEELRINNLLEDCGGLAYITSLTTFGTAASTLVYNIGILKSLYMNRKISDELTHIISSLRNNSCANISEQLKNIQKFVETSQKCDDIVSDIAQIDCANQTNFIRMGFEKIDKVTHGLELGTLSVLTGEPGCGKSTLLNQVAGNILSDGDNVFVYSGELPSGKLKKWFMHTLASENDLMHYFDEFGELKMKPQASFVEKANIWLSNRLFVMKNADLLSLSNLQSIFQQLASKNNVKCFIVDNLMTLVSDNSVDLLSQQKSIVKLLKSIARDLNVAIILVAHPNKESSRLSNPNMFDVAGASEIVNLADYVFKLVPDEDEILLYVLKNRIEGIKNVYLSLFFDKYRRRFYTQNKDELFKKYV